VSSLRTPAPPDAPDAADHGAFATVERAVAAISRGEPVIVVDSPDRENEGDLVIAAEKATPEAMNYMATYGRGLICVPMLRSRLDELAIPPMVTSNTDPHGTAFHVSVDHRTLATTGISAADRAQTIRALASGASTAGDFNRPGHVFPLAYTEGGVVRRAGHTEAAVDLAVLAGCSPCGVICEIAGPDGEMARLPALQEMARTEGMPLLAITDLIAYQRRYKRLVTRLSAARLPLEQGEFRVIAYRDSVDGNEHVALVMGEVAGGDPPLVRVHSECLTGDVLGSRRCDCGTQLQLALQAIADEGRGAVIYMRGHEGRGIGLAAKLSAYELQDEGLDTAEANLKLGHPVDRRDYGIGMQILTDLGIRRMRLLTNNPAKRAGLEGYGLEVVERVPLLTVPNADNVRYLLAKQHRMGHLLDHPAGT
jgi:3,4-dihydroxy 2-butanone 4-phosphate synthase/GTP cyclohydrolase II